MAEENETLNGVDAAVAGGSVIELAVENGGSPRGMPANEDELQAMIAEQLGNDPDAIRKAGQESLARMFALADAIEVKAGKTPRRTATVTAETVVVSAEVAPVTPPVATPPVSTISVPVQAVESAKTEHAKPAIVHPPGYQLLGDGLYTWSPDMWGGLPLHFCPVRTIEAKDRPTLIVGVLVAPAYGRNRMGRIVKLPEGARIVVYVGTAWMPIALLSRGTEGRPIVYAVPTTIDRSGGIPIVKMASHKDDKLVRYETGDGGHEYGVAILYDPDPENPKAPRMVSLETLQSAQQAVEP